MDTLSRPSGQHAAKTAQPPSVAAPTSSNGFLYLCTIIDISTRWVDAVSVRSLEAATVSNALMIGCISRFRVPTFITSDRDTQFKSEIWQILCERLGITHIQIIAHYPCRNGMVE